VYLHFRDDLIVTPDAGEGFLIEDPIAGRFHRLGRAEFLVAAELDGRTPLLQASQRACGHGHSPGFTTSALETLGQWLLTTGLVEVRSVGIGAAPPQGAKAGTSAALDPFYLRMSLGCPDGLLSRLAPLAGWLFSWPAVIATLLLSLWAGGEVAWRWSEFTGSLRRVLCPDQHLWLLGCWLVLKIVHELGHGVACKRLGGDVRDWGLAWLFFAPVPYVDVTSSWRFRSRWERMGVAAAGMYVEWILALVAVACWSWSDSPSLRQACVYAVSLATLSTLLFNLNPLCRFDGYFLLSDLLGWPNLATQGQQVMRAWVGGLLFGDPWPPNSLTRGRWWSLWSYGLAASIWRQLSMLTMAVVVWMAYEGLGLILIALAVWSWYLRPAMQRWGQRNAAHRASPRRLLRCGAIVTVAAALLAGAFWYVPWPGAVAAPGFVEHAQRHVVRAASPGFVEQLLVEDGQEVQAGQRLAVMRNDELELQLRLLEAALQQGEVRLRSLRQRNKLVDLAVEQGRQEALSQQIAQQRRQVDGLVLRAPAAGRIMARRLADLPGSFLEEGAEICTIAAGGRQFRLAVAQNDVPAFAARVGQPLDVWLPGAKHSGVLTSVEPRGSTTPPDLTLTAAAGGPLEVITTDQKDAGPDAPSWQLLEPRFVAQVDLSDESSIHLAAGRRGWAWFRPFDESIGQRLVRYATHWAGQQSPSSRNPSRPQE
jgi:putative peptide zinc metalloprotease protein